jgi:putative ABC transport system permease protein
MKAVGAKNSQILTLFMFESAIFGFFGGIIGVTLGVVIAVGLIGAFNTFGFIKLVIALDLYLLAGTITFSTFLGIFSGLLPAVKASKLKPINSFLVS